MRLEDRAEKGAEGLGGLLINNNVNNPVYCTMKPVRKAQRERVWRAARLLKMCVLPQSAGNFPVPAPTPFALLHLCLVALLPRSTAIAINRVTLVLGAVLESRQNQKDEPPVCSQAVQELRVSVVETVLWD